MTSPETPRVESAVYRGEWKIDVSRDGTLFIRQRDEPLDPRTLPVFGTDDEAEAFRLCMEVGVHHGTDRRVVVPDFGGTLEALDELADRISELSS